MMACLLLRLSLIKRAWEVIIVDHIREVINNILLKSGCLIFWGRLWSSEMRGIIVSRCGGRSDGRGRFMGNSGLLEQRFDMRSRGSRSSGFYWINCSDSRSRSGSSCRGGRAIDKRSWSEMVEPVINPLTCTLKEILNKSGLLSSNIQHSER